MRLPWPFKSHKKEPSQIEILKEQGKNDQALEENRSLNAEMSAATGVAFDQQVIEDEKILDLFDESKPLYHPMLMPLLPYFSRLIFLSNCSERDARAFKTQVNLAISRLKNASRSPNDYLLLDALKAYLFARINDSVNGFKLKALTERSKTLTMRQIEERKKSGLGALLG